MTEHRHEAVPQPQSQARTATAAQPAAPAWGRDAGPLGPTEVLTLQRGAGNARVASAIRSGLIRARAVALQRSPTPAAPAAACECGDPAAARADLLAGRLADRGQHRADGSFVDCCLQTLLEQVTPAVQRLPVPQGGGDTAAKAVAGQPPWVNDFQSRLAGVKGAFDENQRVAQHVLEAYLRAWGLEHAGGYQTFAEFYGGAGAGEQNVASAYFGAGTNEADVKNWCGYASSMALAAGMYRSGLRFRSIPPTDYDQATKRPKERLGTSRLDEIKVQVRKFDTWAKGRSETQKKQGVPARWAEKQGFALWAKQAYNAPLYPGDIIQFVARSHPPGHTGHIATVLSAGSGGRVVIASGNAAYESVRVDEVTREDPVAAGWDYEVKAKRDRRDGFKAPNAVFVFSIQRASWLNIVSTLVRADPTEQHVTDAHLAEMGLERAPKPLDEIWPLAGVAPLVGGAR